MATGNDAIEVTVELEPASEPIRGMVRTVAGDRRPFDGWMELTEAIEEARASPRSLAGGDGPASRVG